MSDNKYQNGKIYQIVDLAYTLCYVGSSCASLSRRMCSHRTNYNGYKAGKRKSRVTSYELFDKAGIENCKIELLENYPCNSKEELLAREGYWIRNTECVNKVIEGRTSAEYMKYWKELNKDKLRTYKQQWYYSNRESNLEKQSKYRQEHIEEKRALDKKYLERNKERIYARKAEKLLCECGCLIRSSDISRHRKTTRHQQALSKEPEPEI
jgi:hypothetical protein